MSLFKEVCEKINVKVGTTYRETQQYIITVEGVKGTMSACLDKTESLVSLRPEEFLKVLLCLPANRIALERAESITEDHWKKSSSLPGNIFNKYSSLEFIYYALGSLTSLALFAKEKGWE